MKLFKNRNVLRISPTDWQDNWLFKKIAPGENVQVDIEEGPFGEQLIITANRTQGRNVRILNTDGAIQPNEYLVLVDASKNHVVVTLPVAHDYLGQLNIVCIDPTHGIELAPNQSTSNLIFDVSNVEFNAKGDALILVSDRGVSLPPPDPDEDDPDIVQLEPALDSHPLVEHFPSPGTWYVVGRYAANWYA